MHDPNLERLFRSLYRIRRAEEEVARIYPTDKIKSPVHLSIGQESISVGVCDALAPEDVVFATYRGHAAYLAKGGDLRAMMAELYGKVTGCARGKGGSMHLIDLAAGFMGTSAVVGTTIPHAVGWALAQRMQQRSGVAIVFFGDGAVEEGVFHESIAFAALKKLPVLFVCENNFFAIHSPQRDRHAVIDLCARARSYGVPAERVDDGDVLRVRELTVDALRAARAGEGPRFLECHAYRWREHVGPGEDFDKGYRSRAEARAWFERDQVTRLGGMLPTEQRERIEREVEDELRAAIAFAEESPFPPEEELWMHLYRERP